MGKKSRYQVLSLLFAAVVGVMVIPMLSSCGKDTAASPTGLNVQLNIVNIGPDRYPVYFYQNYLLQKKTPYIYSIPSGYFYLSTLDLPLQLRSQQNVVLYTKADSLKANCKYSMFVTGLVSEKTDTVIFTVDTATAPALGRGKVRFINAAAHAINLDVYANGTNLYKNRGFKSVSAYTEMPAGVYDFTIYGTGTTSLLTHLPNTTIQDGRLYTVYTRGVATRTDSAAIATAIIINK